jgi:hypothetical protein
MNTSTTTSTTNTESLFIIDDTSEANTSCDTLRDNLCTIPCDIVGKIKKNIGSKHKKKSSVKSQTSAESLKKDDKKEREISNKFPGKITKPKNLKLAIPGSMTKNTTIKMIKQSQDLIKQGLNACYALEEFIQLSQK